MTDAAFSASTPLASFEAHLKTSAKIGSLAVGLIFLGLGLAPRFIGPLHDILWQIVAPPDPLAEALSAYDRIGWIVLTAMGVVALIGFGRELNARGKQINGRIEVYRDRLEAGRPVGGPLVFPFASTPYVRDLKWRSTRQLVLADPDQGRKFDRIYPRLFADQDDYNQLSQVLQQAHSDFWLGADFPASLSRLSLKFGGGLGKGDQLELVSGQLWRQGRPVALADIESYTLAKPVTGLSVDQTVSEVVVRFTADSKLGVALLGAETINHKLSLVRILDLWGVPRR
ncbi:MAG: hypothetical protein LBK42_00330 [Propionibacteriaceae bacterium]|nr:hypothetical protein [Propionibacteriaceae bacterium]